MADARIKVAVRQRVVNELKEIGILTGYLFIVFGAINLMRAAVLHSHGIELAYWGAGLVKAVLLAKFVMIGKALRIGEHHHASPLIWPTLRKAFAFLVFLAVLTVVEECAVGLFHHRSIGESLADLLGRRLAESLASMLLLLLVLIPYFAFQVLAEALGEGRLVRMFLVDRNAFDPRRPGPPPGPSDGDQGAGTTS